MAKTGLCYAMRIHAMLCGHVPPILSQEAQSVPTFAAAVFDLQSDPVLGPAHPTAQAECCARVWVWHLQQTVPGSWAGVVALLGVVVAPAAHVRGTPAEPGRHLAAVPAQQ
jgi:hypothetical protein